MAPGEESVGRTLAQCSLREVASKFQVSVQRIQQIERLALLKLRRGILPFLKEHNPVAFERYQGRETDAQRWAARTGVRRQLSAKQAQIVAQLRKLADTYEESGQVTTARAIGTTKLWNSSRESKAGSVAAAAARRHSQPPRRQPTSA